MDGYFKFMQPGLEFASGNFRVGAMAFADDLLIFTSTPMGLQERLSELEGYLSPRGLEVKEGKSFIVVLLPSGRVEKMKVDTTCTFNVASRELPKQDLTSTSKYLGIMFDPKGRRGIFRSSRMLLSCWLGLRGLH